VNLDIDTESLQPDHGRVVSRPLEVAEIESLCGRPEAFHAFVSGLLAPHPERSDLETTLLGRWARAELDRRSRVVWWLWPWEPEPGEREPWWRCRQGELAPTLRWLESEVLSPKGVLRVVVARAPRQPKAWLEHLSSWLRAQVDRPKLRVELLGPVELLAWAEGRDEARDRAWLRPWRALAAREQVDSANEAALRAALDAGEATADDWAVVADELLERGDPLGESLALAVAALGGARGREELAQTWVEREAKRMLEAERPEQLLAFVDGHGRSFDVVDFLADPPAELERGQHAIHMWAERVGPFVTRLLASTDYEAWAGLGLDEALLHAPELRYLSRRRLGCITPLAADISSFDLSGFDLSALGRVCPRVWAVEARLRGCDLRQADLSGWVLDGADLRGANSDLGTRVSGASFVEARVSPRLYRRLRSWNTGLFLRQGGVRADIRGVEVDVQPSSEK
jgi:hypothetical protein